MSKVPIPEQEAARLEALLSCAILDTPPEEAFDDVVRIASVVCNTPMAMVSLVGEERQWFKARVGLEPQETSRDMSFCAHAICETGTMVVEDASADPRFSDNPLVTGEPRIRFYAGAPLRMPDGAVLGTVCVADHTPRVLTADQSAVLEALARLVVAELRLRQEGLTLQDRRTRFGGFLESLAEGVVGVDSSGNICFADRAAEGVLGFSGTRVMGRPWMQVLDPDPQTLSTIRVLLGGPGSPPRVVSFSRTGRVAEVRCALVPNDPSTRLLLLSDITELERLREHYRERTRALGFIGSSPAIRKVVDQIKRVAAVNLPVLFVGETGTGKELGAKALHAASPLRDRPFVTVNCGALSESLLSSQLFGHRKGAFTGAIQDQKGLFEAAAGGTIFLDEIGEMPLPMQASLLRVLEEREVVRLGETEPRKVDFRLVCASNRDLSHMVQEGTFRKDLYYRIRGHKIEMPPLRERREDIPLLARHFADRVAQESGIESPVFGHEAMARMLEYDWPGNVREFRSTMTYAVLHGGGTVEIGNLPPELTSPGAGPTPFRRNTPSDDRAEIVRALEAAGGNRSEAARLLGMSRATFYRRLRALGIPTE